MSRHAEYFPKFDSQIYLFDPFGWFVLTVRFYEIRTVTILWPLVGDHLGDAGALADHTLGTRAASFTKFYKPQSTKNSFLIMKC